jgi:hypothetical protein
VEAARRIGGSYHWKTIRGWYYQHRKRLKVEYDAAMETDVEQLYIFFPS